LFNSYGLVTHPGSRFAATVPKIEHRRFPPLFLVV
jgi:hypothetical protein